MKNKRSRTSGVNTEAEKATWRRRPGSPGGVRSEAEKMGATGWRPRRWRVTRPLLAAWQARDQARIREILRLQPWEDGPWVIACPAHTHGEAVGACCCAVLALRRKILEALGAAEQETKNDGPC